MYVLGVYKAQSVVLFISIVANSRYKTLQIVLSKNSSSDSKLETQASKLNSQFSKASSIEVRVSSRDCQLTFDRHCTLITHVMHVVHHLKTVRTLTEFFK